MSKALTCCSNRATATEQCFQQAIEADEGFALAYAGLSMMQMLRGAAADAKASVAKAQQLARSATRREQQHVEGVALFTNGQGPKSLAVTLEHLDEFPARRRDDARRQPPLPARMQRRRCPELPRRALRHAAEAGAELRRRLGVPRPVRLRPPRDRTPRRSAIPR